MPYYTANWKRIRTLLDLETCCHTVEPHKLRKLDVEKDYVLGREHAAKRLNTISCESWTSRRTTFFAGNRFPNG